MDGNKAVQLDLATNQVKGSATNVTFAGETDENKIALHYDAILERLYVGLRINTGGNNNDQGKAIVVGKLTPVDEANKKLELQDIVSNAAITSDTDNIVVAKSNGTTINLRVMHINILHASTGPDYLIINGGIGTTDAVGNTVFALPLVNNPENESHGSLAKKDSNLIGNVFTTPADVQTDLPTKDDIPATIGDGPVPIEATSTITDLVVVGDTVYVATNDSGIFFSQALFDSTGKIVRWTPWTRRVVSFMHFQE